MLLIAFVPPLLLVLSLLDLALAGAVTTSNAWEAGRYMLGMLYLALSPTNPRNYLPSRNNVAKTRLASIIYQTIHNDHHLTVSDYCLHFLGYNGHIDALVSEPCVSEPILV